MELLKWLFACIGFVCAVCGGAALYMASKDNLYWITEDKNEDWYK